MNRVMTVQERHSVGILHVTPVIQATRRYARIKRKNEHQDEVQQSRQEKILSAATKVHGLNNICTKSE